MELFLTVLLIWLVAIFTFIIVAIGIDNIYGAEKYYRFTTVVSISCALKFLGV